MIAALATATVAKLMDLDRLVSFTSVMSAVSCSVISYSSLESTLLPLVSIVSPDTYRLHGQFLTKL